MIRFLTISLLLSIASLTTLAQTEETEEETVSESIKLRLPTRIGNYLVGANLFLANVTFMEGEKATYNVGLNPRVGFFILPNIALGAAMNAGVQSFGRNHRSIYYGATPFARVYFAHNNEAKPTRPLQFFVEAGIGFSGAVTRFENYNNGIITLETERSNGLRIYILPGVDYFINKHIAVEAGLEYAYISDNFRTNSLGLNVGFQVFLGR